MQIPKPACRAQQAGARFDIFQKYRAAPRQTTPEHGLRRWRPPKQFQADAGIPALKEGYDQTFNTL